MFQIFGFIPLSVSKRGLARFLSLYDIGSIYLIVVYPLFYYNFIRKKPATFYAIG